MSEPTPPTGDVSATPPAGGTRLRMFGRTDVGMVREHNEDNFIILDLSQNVRNMPPEIRSHVVGPRGTLFAVCDGMGGAAAGEVASQMAVDTLHELFQEPAKFPTRDHFAQRLSYAIVEAGARIYLAAKSNRAQRGMGTTSTVAGVIGSTLFVGQVGDSRAYLFRSGKVKQITKDQSLVTKLIEAGQLTEAEAETFEHAHIILQALGTSDSVSVDLTFMDLRQGDATLLCSDGLSGFVTAEQMREVLAANDDPAECCRILIDMANQAGGHDNITLIVTRYDGDIPPLGPGDEYFGYQPYVIENPVEQAPAAQVTSKIKGADAPPPGKDVKNAVSMRPPPMSLPPPAVSPAPTAPSAGPISTPPMTAMPDDDLQVPVNGPSRGVVIAGVFIVIALALVAGAIWLLRGDAGPNRESPQDPGTSTRDVSSRGGSTGPTPLALPAQSNDDAAAVPTVVLATDSGPSSESTLATADGSGASTAAGTTADAAPSTPAAPATDAARPPPVPPGDAAVRHHHRATAPSTPPVP